MAQQVALAKKPHIIVATPGRLQDHLENTKGFSLRSLKYLVRLSFLFLFLFFVRRLLVEDVGTIDLLVGPCKVDQRLTFSPDASPSLPRPSHRSSTKPTDSSTSTSDPSSTRSSRSSRVRGGTLTSSRRR
jgi:hypothetical protein